MKYDFDQIVDRSKISVKYGTPGLLHPNCKLPEQVIPMWIADMDFACCDKILDSIKARVDQLTLGYENPVTAEYLLAVTGWFDQRLGGGTPVGRPHQRRCGGPGHCHQGPH